MKHLLRIWMLLGALSLTAQSQSVDWSGSVEAEGFFSNEEVLPFWIYSNTSSEVGAASNFSALAHIRGRYNIGENGILEGGVSGMYRDEVSTEFQRRDLYLNYSNRWLSVTVGAKRNGETFFGLSATNKKFLWASNARPLPGVLIQASQPIRVNDQIGIDWGIGHYQLNDERFVDNTRVHYKHLGVIFSWNERNRITARIQHFAQWAGTSPVFGALPSDFNAFVDVFFARMASEVNIDGEQLNAVGNHLGSYFIEYDFATDIGGFALYHEHPFEDGSGTGWSNFPDGVWGVHFKPNQNRVIQGVLYEYIDTSNQSANSVAGRDNYFNNNVYRSGWTYEGQVIGIPFISFDPNITITDQVQPIVNNRVRVHHLGLAGVAWGVQWRFRSSLSQNVGTFSNPFPTAVNRWYNHLQMLYTIEKYGAISVQVGLDSGDLTDTVAGAGLGYRYQF